MELNPDPGTWPWIVGILCTAIAIMASWFAFVWRSDRDYSEKREDKVLEIVKENTRATQKSADATDRMADAMNSLASEIRGRLK